MTFNIGAQLKFSGKVRFESDAPLEFITAVADKVQGVITTDDQRFAFTVSIKSFNGFNSALQKEHFNENYLESEKYPLASYSGRLLDKIDFSTSGTFTVRTKGKFEIRGVSAEKIFKHQVTIKNGQVTIGSVFTLLLSDFNIHIPRIVQNKIAEEINVFLEAKADLK